MLSKLEEATPAILLGGKIRALRQRLKRTLDHTATAAGISKPFLSQVERGLATPSIRSLNGIASALGVAVQYFVNAPAERQPVRSSAELKFFKFAESANLFAQLTRESSSQQLEAVLVRFPPGQMQPGEMLTRASEEFLYVISGEVSLTLGHEAYVLQAGDSAHYPSTLPRAWMNSQRIEALALWVGTPQLF
ncbi:MULTISPECIES: helix-turn-helix domain-containing protein [Paraburkholderia]|uniref:helix-turn-helix domain-containing protein n=1 Tax=Paraburkholderia TaxID=1822464 RepID=UPI002252E4B3|nr:MULTISPECIES: XRE family transcriptional regulator [Paraburkholderia]MCX4163474.1 XRE family transcriptional regulator [Paraburkholderia megapolitana]MDN7158969.1 XRE family transcriptional regulator [Paraburkholderia sp. CHISQ3]MDQ6496016.1 XRE family transcriptional regulator [Paraburkholderia megapolitana]